MNIPNSLSIFRLMLIPTFIIVFFMPGKNAMMTAALILILSGLTDFFDGYIARRFGQITDIGKFLDPLADKLTHLTVFVCLWIGEIIPLWVLIVYVIKEILVFAGGTRIYDKQKFVVTSKWFGKVATGIFYASVIAILVFDLPQPMNMILILIVLTSTVIACLLYIKVYFDALIKKKSN